MRNKGDQEGDEYSVKFVDHCDRLATADWIDNVLLTSELPLQRTNPMVLLTILHQYYWCCKHQENPRNRITDAVFHQYISATV
jgi:hypothetical protein